MVTIFTKDNCVYCTNAKTLLASRGVPFNEQKLGEDFTKEFLLEQFPSVRTFPVIVIDGFNIGGFNELKEYLDREDKNKGSAKFLTEEN